MWLVELLKLYHPTTEPMSHDRAMAICALVPQDMITNDMVLSFGLENQLKAAFPEHNWRTTLNRRGERARAMLTILNDDPREHYVDGAWCPTCGKNHKKDPLPGDLPVDC